MYKLVKMLLLLSKATATSVNIAEILGKTKAATLALSLSHALLIYH